ncbi:threonylcarbamoyladenosine tRNA methylthiotransferase [Parasteatoda tepidariorum]|uniref:threonylcarbamoyladenosine tRNA methylthiotransferase n=1 Tax=Parasteatoda tepidariorum TaxID=114398 RepID=UPI001C7262AE|nr:threonylcarbamoyladenosine tRNA methylthiotransferase [Parasteatoda tepidariorum]XP_042905087.1 threonylcarbamoyladenosine tRNA methylthiotransferase [Parasteatoda tepidariorum]
MGIPDEEGVDDIEDLGQVKLSSPVNKVRRKNEPKEEIFADSIIPGSQKVYVKTWGCAHNSSDSEYMAGLLDQAGYSITDDSDLGDIWLLNSCTVKNPAEDHFRNAIEEGRKKNKQVIVAGCVSQAAPKTPYLQSLSMIGVQQIDRVVEVVEETLKGHSVQLLGSKRASGKKLGGASLQLPKVRRNELIEIIPINTGCLNHCTYCKTKQARGNLASYPIQEIVDRAKQAIAEGVKEIWITSEDTGAYGRDIGETLPKLLYQLVEVIPDDCMLRLGMTNPPYILEHLEDMSKILAHPRVYSFLHVPVQSGSDYVLGEMKREYCIDDFKLVVEFLRKRVPDITIATDIICGFPTETPEDFQETLNLVKQYHFPVLYINQFFPRPGTPAAKMKKIPGQEVKQRTKTLSDYFQSYTCYDKNVGCTQKVLVTEVSHDGEHYVGHNKCYEQVLVPKEEQYLGKFITVKIVKAGKHYMIGQPVSSTNSEDFYKVAIRNIILFSVIILIIELLIKLLQNKIF